MKTLALVIFSLACVSTKAQDTDSLKTKVLDPAAMLADFKYFRQLLLQTHPGLYRYTPKQVMQAKFDSSEALLHTPMPFYNF